MEEAEGRSLEQLADHEHRTVWVVEAELAALLGIVLHCCLTFPALVATVELVVAHRSAVMSSFAVKFVPAWR